MRFKPPDLGRSVNHTGPYPSISLQMDDAQRIAACALSRVGLRSTVAVRSNLDSPAFQVNPCGTPMERPRASPSPLPTRVAAGAGARGRRVGHASEVSAGVVGLLVARTNGRLVRLSGELHVAAGGHGDQVGGLEVFPWAGLSKGADGCHDQPRIGSAQGLVVQAQSFQIPNWQTFHHHIGLDGQLLENSLSEAGFQVEGD